MIPRLISLSPGVSKKRTVAWDRYWAGIDRTRVHRDVLWDAGSEHEFTGYRETAPGR
jgi:hypothetical protein